MRELAYAKSEISDTLQKHIIQRHAPHNSYSGRVIILGFETYVFVFTFTFIVRRPSFTLNSCTSGSIRTECPSLYQLNVGAGVPAVARQVTVIVSPFANNSLAKTIKSNQ